MSKKILITLILIIKFTWSNCQIMTLYYNDQGELTTPGLASHYRVAKFDSLYNNFDGISYEYNPDKILLGIYHYNNGSLEQVELVNNGSDTVQYTPKKLSRSKQEILNNKNNFVQSIYIRKNDYKPIIHKLNSIPMDKPDSIIMEGEKVMDSEVYTIVEDPASFPGGMNNMIEFLSYYLKYPQDAQKAKITGKVYVQFIINENGTLSNIKAVKGIGYGCDEAAVHAISMLPDWKPGYQRGKPVKVSMILPITFQ